MSLFIWSTLFLVALYDLKENRIPNYCLLLLIVLYVIDALISFSSWSEIGMNLVAAATMFFSCLVLFFVRVMAPGDVKLMGVLGYWIGWGNLLDSSFYILISSGVLGILFILGDLVNPASKYRNLILFLDKDGRKEFLTKDNLRMPFAPSVFIGLALYQYLSFH
ncbi:prepilin peptidase [Vibrio hannami]|uniref:A24 family peptidase n=1 Tax=Vibrio hannami TaxID=2717094 RepID=UPI00240F8A2E|nr:prepilin peptidase [Vibrio hannami]MDG3087327.1 prepilin peptidase [Vibrio hannami]